MRLINIRKRFEDEILLHLDAANNLARWLNKSEHDAEDVVQEAFLKAFKAYATFRGGDKRAWILRIVRNTSYTLHQKQRSANSIQLSELNFDTLASDNDDPEDLLMQELDTRLLKESVACLPVEFREVVILRDMEQLSYKEIAHICDIPIGTVMSRLARARKRLVRCLTADEERQS